MYFSDSFLYIMSRAVLMARCIVAMAVIIVNISVFFVWRISRVAAISAVYAAAV